MDIWLKCCQKCRWFKSFNAFGKNRSAKDGKNYYCLDCCRKKQSTYREENREELRVKSAEYFATHKEQHQATVRAYDASHRKERKAYYDTHKEETNLKRRQAHAEDPQKNRASQKVWRDNNPEKTRHYREDRAEQRATEWALWYATHQDHILDYRLAHSAETAARGAKWRQENPEKHAACQERRRARKQNLPDTWTAEQQAFMLEYWHYACAACGNPKGLFWSLAHDHWIPLASPDCPGTICTNMIPLCHGKNSCNTTKNDMDPHAWLLRRFGPKKAAKIEKAIATYFAIVAETFPLCPTTSTEKGI